MDKCILNCLLLILSFTLFSSCEKNNISTGDPLRFSADTIHFDTVFANVGSTTRELRVINNSKGKILIDEVCLAGGRSSPFRLNIDGEPAVSKSGITLGGHDSIFIFVDVIVDPSNSSSPVAVTDSIIFDCNGRTMQVQLLAWGQDIILIDNHVIATQTWRGKKPYVIYGDVIVDTLETLTIEQGVKVLFHKGASISIAGTLEVNGTGTERVLFATDRIEKSYDDVPGLWDGIFLLPVSAGNRIRSAEIRNSTFGITVGESKAPGKGTDLKLFNTVIAHSTVSGLSAINSAVESANSLFYHCGRYCIWLASGGEYSFTYCTIVNQWDYGFRSTSSVTVTEKPSLPGVVTGQMNLDLNNCVVYGDLASEIEVIPASNIVTGNYYFDHCLVRMDTLNSPLWSGERFTSAVVNKNPRFIDSYTYDYRPDTLSPMIGSANAIYSVNYPFDIRNVSRISYGEPDIGAYERIPGEGKKTR